ncbi:MerR family DNA-binding protein, partial [Nostoc sp. NIES-2111]
GLHLSEIKDFLQVYDAGELPCDHIKTKLEDKVQAIDEQIQQLLILKQELVGLLSGWEANSDEFPTTICPIIEND